MNSSTRPPRTSNSRYSSANSTADYSSVKTSAYPGTKKFVHHCHVKALALAGAPDACETYDSLAPSQLLTCKFRHLIKPLRLSTSFSMPVQRRRVHFPSNSIFGRPAIASPMHAPQPVMRVPPIFDCAAFCCLRSAPTVHGAMQTRVGRWRIHRCVVIGLRSSLGSVGGVWGEYIVKFSLR